ncbi:MAG: hypothetical protein PVG65_04970 [Candidatus Thorarchaeota archaeon]|jgi:protein-disulfide isomerase
MTEENTGQGHVEHRIVHHEPKKKNILIKNPWIFSTIVFAIACIILFLMVYSPNITGSVTAGSSMDGDEAGEKLAEYLTSMVPSGEVTYVSYEDTGDLYKIIVEYQEEEIPVYITKDGEYFVQGVTPIIMTEPSQQQSQTQEQVQVEKTDKPVAELFVMTHCPYGTQAEKGFIPMLKALGSKIDGKIRFVHYFMHGDIEEEETYRQVCIREEQGAKYLNYLECFLGDGNSTSCLDEAGIDASALDTCMSEKAEDYYAVDSALSQQYGVGGSPTLVLNGVIASGGRSPSAYLTAVCSAFNTMPSECGEELDSTTPAPGFGYEGSGSASTASCG